MVLTRSFCCASSGFRRQVAGRRIAPDLLEAHGVDGPFGKHEGAIGRPVLARPQVSLRLAQASRHLGLGLHPPETPFVQGAAEYAHTV